jgi:hypothetical protein
MFGGPIPRRQRQGESHLPPGKGDYVAVSDEELAALEIESSHTIDIESFVARPREVLCQLENLSAREPYRLISVSVGRTSE